MKNLKQYIEEKLIVNKGYDSYSTMRLDLIDVLFNNIEKNDVSWSIEEDNKDVNINTNWIIARMINTNMHASFNSEREHMINDAVKQFKMLPEIIHHDKFSRALLKNTVYDEFEPSKYVDECNKLFKITDTDKNFTNKKAVLLNNMCMKLSMNELYAIIFLYNEMNNNVWSVFVIEFKN